MSISNLNNLKMVVDLIVM